MMEETPDSNENVNLLPKSEPRMSWRIFWPEMKTLLKLSMPLIVSQLLTSTILMESVIMCGYLGKTELASVSMANSLSNICGLCIANGFGSACDTFFSQIYGSRHRKFLGVLLQRSILVGTLLPLALISIHLNWEPLLILCGQDREVAARSSYYLILFTPGIFFTFQYQILSRYLQNQYYVYVPMVCCVIANMFNIVTQYILIVKFGYGLEASAVCQSITYFLLWFLHLLYIVITGLYKETWKGFSREAFLEWKQFFKLAMVGVGSIFFNYSVFEILIFCCGLLGTTQLSTQAILWYVEAMVYAVGFGIGTAVNIRIGDALGAKMPKRAFLSFKCGFIAIILYGLLEITLINSLRQYIPMVFTSDKSVIELTTFLLPIVSVVEFLDILMGLQNGTYNGCGLQKVSVILVLIAYYLIGMPISLSLGFATKLGITGMWIGLFIGLMLSQTGGLSFIFFKVDWSQQVVLAETRVKNNVIAEESLEKSNNILQIAARRRNLSTSLTMMDGGALRANVVVVSDKKYRRIYQKRAGVYFLALLILFLGIVINITIRKIGIDNIFPIKNETVHNVTMY